MTTRPALVVAVAAVCLLAAAAAPAAGQSEPAVGFGDTQRQVAQGDVATIEIQLRNTDAASLRILSSDRNYRATLRVRDRNDDGTVGVEFDTFRAAGDDPDAAFGTVDAADNASVVTASHAGDGDVLDTGRYNLILGTSDTRIASRLSLVAPGAATGSSASVVPADAPLPAPETPDVNRSDAGTDTLTAAVGDRIRADFGVRGLGGIVAGDAPAHNLVFPADSAPGARTTHAVSASPNETIGVRSVTIDYATDGSTPARDVYRISGGDIEALGVDTTGDGYVDRSAQASVQNLRTSSSGQLMITFDRAIDVGANHTFLASYPVRNPDTTEPQTVGLTLAGNGTTYREAGRVQYGPAGQGTLGHGVDLRIESVDRERPPTDPLAPVETVYDPIAGSLVVDADTNRLDRGEHTLRLSVGDAAPEPLPRASLTERVVVADPAAEFTRLSASGGSRLAVAAETNLAPGNSLVIQVRAEGGISQLSNCVTTVDPDGTAGCEFDLQRPPQDLDIEVTIERNGSVIAGPVAYDE